MAMLFDPLQYLRSLGAYVHADCLQDGTRAIRLTWQRNVRCADQRKGERISARFERLLLLQLDVPPGSQPRTVQQLVAAGKIVVADGRYKIKPG